MQFTTFLLAALAAITPLTAALAAPDVTDVSASDSVAIAGAKKVFRLKTNLHNPKRNKRHNNLYISANQLSKTENDIYLSSSKPNYASHFNGTNLMFNLTNVDGETHWSMENVQTVPYTGWQSSMINAGMADPAVSQFYLNATSGLQTANTGFGGWRVCDWWHGDAQLFWVVKYYDVNAPASCSDVDLIPDYSAWKA